MSVDSTDPVVTRIRNAANDDAVLLLEKAALVETDKRPEDPGGDPPADG